MTVIIMYIEQPRNTCKTVVGKREGVRPLGSHRYRREDNIKKNPKKDYVRLWTTFNRLRMWSSGVIF
jgi:proteasome lid subunit RPN8/RPN11